MREVGSNTIDSDIIPQSRAAEEFNRMCSFNSSLPHHTTQGRIARYRDDVRALHELPHNIDVGASNVHLGTEVAQIMHADVSSDDLFAPRIASARLIRPTSLLWLVQPLLIQRLHECRRPYPLNLSCRRLQHLDEPSPGVWRLPLR